MLSCNVTALEATTYFIKSKDEVLEKFEEYEAMVTNQTNKRINIHARQPTSELGADAENMHVNIIIGQGRIV